VKAIRRPDQYLRLRGDIWHYVRRVPKAVSHIEETKARLEIDLPGNGPRETYLRARVICRGSQLLVTSIPHQDSSLLTPFRSANVLLRRMPNSVSAKAGDVVDVIELGSGPSVFSSG